jgi:hypothetical protein
MTTEEYMAKLLDEAPPLTSDQAALIIRTFVGTEAIRGDRQSGRSQ